MVRTLMTAMAATSLVVAPTIAQASASAAPLARASAEQSGSNALTSLTDDDGARPWVIGLAGLAAILAILALTDTWPFDDDDAVSP